MAQDFHSVFPLNESETTLNEADLQGVALSAIQGLNQKFDDLIRKRDQEIRRLEDNNQNLQRELEGLMAIVAKLQTAPTEPVGPDGASHLSSH